MTGSTKIVADVTAPREQEIARVEFFIDDELIFADTEPPWQVVHDFGAGAATHVVRVVAEHRDGPTVSDFVITRSLKAEYVVNVQRVLLDVSVRDSKKRLIRGLGQSDFRVREGGVEQKVLSVSPEERPLLIGIVIDSSGSMRGERIEQAREAACAFVKTLRDEDRVFVIDFDENVYLIQQPTHDKHEACASISSTEAVGGTALRDAVNAAYRVIHQQESERRALVVLSDGEDSESHVTFDDLMLTTQLSDVTVYAIGLDVGLLGSANSELTKLSTETGGRAFFVRRARDLAGTYEAIAEELRSLYLVIYSSTRDSLDGKFVPIEVDVTGGKFDVRHRRGYYASPE